MRKWVLICGYLLCVIGLVTAQVEDCEVIVRQSLQSIDDLCQGIERNRACYGTSQVDRTFVDASVGDDVFANPGDKELLVNFSNIQPRPLNPETGEFGVTLLNVQANVPNTVPGQAVLFLLAGDANLTNEALSDDSDGSSFQSFYFLPGTGESPCYEAEPTLTIQTPGNITTTLYFNGVETDFSPGTLLTITDKVCTIHRGSIVQRTSDGEVADVLLANETVDIFIDQTGAINVTNKRGISEREYQRGEVIQQALNSVSFESDWQSQFLVPPDEFGEEPTVRLAPRQPAGSIAENVDTSELVIVGSGSGSSSSSNTADCETQHTVRSGETLHMIAERYDTSVLGISEFNGLENPRLIYAGDVLCIPNVGSGFEPLPAGY